MLWTFSFYFLLTKADAKELTLLAASPPHNVKFNLILQNFGHWRLHRAHGSYRFRHSQAHQNLHIGSMLMSWPETTEHTNVLLMRPRDSEMTFLFCPDPRIFVTSMVLIRPAENFWVITPQTSLKFLGQNQFGDQFWGQSEARKGWPQVILGPGAMGLTGGLPLDLK